MTQATPLLSSLCLVPSGALVKALSDLKTMPVTEGWGGRHGA